MESATEQMNCLKHVKNQYENYPYPFRDPENEKKTFCLAQMAYLAKINHYCFRGKQNFNSSFKLLDAGGGTGDITIMFAEQLRDTDVKIVYLDMSSASMEVAKQRAKIRASMRDRMMASPLCDKDLFIKNIEQAYRNIWKKWCSSKNAKLQSKDANKEMQVSLGD